LRLDLCTCLLALAPFLAPPPAEPDVAAAGARPLRLFSPTSFWNAPVSRNAALDPRSPQLVAELVRQVREEQRARHGPWIGTRGSSTPIYRVARDQPRVRVRLDSRIPHGPGPAFRAVPLPPAARPAAGADGHLTVWQPAADSLWEFFRLGRRRDGWHARWGGAIRHVSRSPGYYTSRSWPGARWYWGATATSLPVAGGVITVEELRRGRIDHALALNIKQARAGVYSWPAQRTDGETPGEDAIPEGARFRLDTGLDLEQLHLPRATRVLALAAQRYGMVVRDKSSTVAFYAEDPTRFRRDPYRRLFGPDYPGHLNRLLERFPWDRLQLLRMRLCRSPTAAAPMRRTGARHCAPAP
jgi:hypothetical protein